MQRLSENEYIVTDAWTLCYCYDKQYVYTYELLNVYTHSMHGTDEKFILILNSKPKGKGPNGTIGYYY